MTDQKNRLYKIEVSEGEAQKIDQRAELAGISTPDFVLYCVRQVCFGVIDAINRLAEKGQSGTSDKE